MFKSILNNESEIADFIDAFATIQIDIELVKEYFYGCKAILKKVSVQCLEEGNPNQNIRIQQNEKLYKKLPPETMPPLLVENNEVLDGNHRLRLARKIGMKEIMIYNVVEA